MNKQCILWVMVHLDLFSGIGGFAYAVDQVWPGTRHIFCDNEPYAQAILTKHWPGSYIYDDIRKITADTFDKGLEGYEQEYEDTGRRDQCHRKGVQQKPFILTGGFPCQPFSAAGLRRGTADDRHLWPEMLRVIRLTEPEWVIAENVGGIITWNDGLVFEQVCADLEAAGYEVQPFVIPAVAVNAPHRRDRVWFVAHSVSRTDRGGAGEDGGKTQEERLQERLQERHEVGQPGKPSTVRDEFDTADWNRDWLEVATELCSVDDGVPGRLGETTVSKSQHRAGQLKAYGNAIVPEVAMEIMKAMKETK